MQRRSFMIASLLMPFAGLADILSRKWASPKVETIPGVNYFLAGKRHWPLGMRLLLDGKDITYDAFECHLDEGWVKVFLRMPVEGDNPASVGKVMLTPDKVPLTTTLRGKLEIVNARRG